MLEMAQNLREMADRLEAEALALRNNASALVLANSPCPHSNSKVLKNDSGHFVRWCNDCNRVQAEGGPSSGAEASESVRIPPGGWPENPLAWKGTATASSDAEVPASSPPERVIGQELNPLSRLRDLERRMGVLEAERKLEQAGRSQSTRKITCPYCLVTYDEMNFPVGPNPSGPPSSESLPVSQGTAATLTPTGSTGDTGGRFS